MLNKIRTLSYGDVFLSLLFRIQKETAIMSITSAITRKLAWSLALLGFLAVAPMAQAAAITDESGTICKNYNAGQATLVDYFPNATRNLATYSLPVICPVARNTSDTNGAYVYIDINHYGTQTTYCTAYSVNYNGTYLASGSANWTGAGFHEFAISLYGAGKSNAWSNYSVLCTIPGNGSGLLYDVDLYEY